MEKVSKMLYYNMEDVMIRIAQGNKEILSFIHARHGTEWFKWNTVKDVVTSNGLAGMAKRGFVERRHNHRGNEWRITETTSERLCIG